MQLTQILLRLPLILKKPALGGLNFIILQCLVGESF